MRGNATSISSCIAQETATKQPHRLIRLISYFTYGLNFELSFFCNWEIS